METDVIVIGAGLSGLAAAIRLAHYGRKVCIFERHRRIGGLNSHYRRNGIPFDVGLHAMTNYAPAAARRSAMARLLRQLRLDRKALALQEQHFSLVRFPDAELRFSNDPGDLEAGIATRFPGQLKAFRRLRDTIRDQHAFSLEPQSAPTRPVLERIVSDPLLRDMLLCPVMYYGNPAAHDMEFNHFCVIFQSLFQEGLCRPAGGIRALLAALEGRLSECGAELRLGCGVRGLERDGDTVQAALLDDGSRCRARHVLSCAGFVETMGLLTPAAAAPAVAATGRISVAESIFVLDRPAAELGFDASVLFFNTAVPFQFGVPDARIDARSGVLCAPGNFGAAAAAPDRLRLTHLANGPAWLALDGASYRNAKADLIDRQRRTLAALLPAAAEHVVSMDTFTPKTIARYTGHRNGALYGSPVKHRDGRTPLSNLYICGTDQGFLGIVGALLSGVSIANARLLRGP